MPEVVSHQNVEDTQSRNKVLVEDFFLGQLTAILVITLSARIALSEK